MWESRPWQRQSLGMPLRSVWSDTQHDTGTATAAIALPVDLTCVDMKRTRRRCDGVHLETQIIAALDFKEGTYPNYLLPNTIRAIMSAS